MTLAPTRTRLMVLVALLLLGLSPAPVFASTIAIIGTVTDTGVLSPNTFSLANPAGTAETRGIIELDLSIFGTDAIVTEAFLILSASFTHEKTLEVYSYADNDLLLEASDFFQGEGTALYSQLHQPSSGELITIDITADLNALVTSDAASIGFNFRETENPGNIVAIEYLVLGTIVSLGQTTTIVITSSVNPTTGLFGPATVSTVPEPVTLGLTMVGLGAVAVRRMRQRSRPSDSRG